MRKAGLALRIGVALIGFTGAANADTVPLPRPAPLPKTGFATAAESAPRPPAPVSNSQKRRVRWRNSLGVSTSASDNVPASRLRTTAALAFGAMRTM